MTANAEAPIRLASGINIHGAYFVPDGTITLMRKILRGTCSP